MTLPIEAPNTDYDTAALREVVERRFTWAAGFERNAHRYAHRTAMTDLPSGRVWTYAELGADAGRLVAGLAAHGVGVGDVVAHQLPNCPEFALLYIAAQGLRAVSSPMNFRLAPGETAYALDQLRPAVYVYDTERSEQTAESLAKADFRPRVLIGAGGGALLPGAIRFEELCAEQAPVFTAPADGSTWDETSRLFTSGTTGMPKAVPLTSFNEVLTAHDVIMHFPVNPHDRTLNMSPWFHRGGNYCAGPNTMFYVGGEVVIMPKFDAGAVLDAVEEHRLTYLVGAPTNLERLADAQEAGPRDLSSLHGIITMGAPLERAAAIRYQDVLTPRLGNGYGVTETFWNTFLRPYDVTDMPGTAGQACIDDDVAVVRVFEDRVAEPDELAAKDNTEVGEVIMRSVKAGYAYAEQPARAEEEVPRRLGLPRGPGHLGRERDDHHRRPQGRHDHLRRRERPPGAGRGGPGGPSGRRRGGRHGPARHGVGPARGRLRRAPSRLLHRPAGGRHRARPVLQGQRRPGELQAPAPLRLRRRAADDRDREEEALRAARPGPER